MRHFDRKIPISDQIQLFGSDAVVIVKAVCAALLDSSVLVQRCALDFLSLAFPMHIEVIKFSHEDLVEVVAGMYELREIHVPVGFGQMYFK